LIDHLNRHKGFTPHTCHICQKSYMQISKLKGHLKTHSNDKVRDFELKLITIVKFCLDFRNSCALNVEKASIAPATSDNTFCVILEKRSSIARNVQRSSYRKEISKLICQLTKPKNLMLARSAAHHSLSPIR
jgi:hypothetical protein